MNSVPSMVKDSSKLKLLVLTSSFPRSREDFAGSFVAEFAESLSDSFEIVILSPAAKGAPVKERRGNLIIYRFNYFWPLRAQLLDASADLQPLLERSLFARLQVIPFFIVFLFRALLLARGADIICSHWFLPAGLVGAFVAKVMGRPHIAIEHSGALHLLKKLRTGRLLTGFIVRNAKRLIVVSEQLRKQLIALYPAVESKVDVLPMGIDYRAFGINRVKSLTDPTPTNIAACTPDNKSLCTGFGAVTAVRPPRNMQLSARFQF